jgi:hypothetical protein
VTRYFIKRHPRLFVQSKAELYRYLPIIHFAIFNVSTALDDLELTQIVQRLRRFGNRALDSILDAGFGSACQFNLFVEMPIHRNLPTLLIFRQSALISAYQEPTPIQ